MNKETMIRDWALGQLGSPYVYGSTGSQCTTGERQARMKQYPAQAEFIKASCPRLSGRQESCRGCAYSGKLCFDCAQFVRKALEQAGIKLPSGASSQWKAPLWSWKGEISEEAGRRLCLVFRQSGDSNKPMAHVGLSLGDGRVMDARSSTRGVVLSSLTQYPWTHYAVCEMDEKGKDEMKEEVVKPEIVKLQMGAEGEAVRELQKLLMQKGFPLPRFGADGRFGAETLQALQEAQLSAGLERSDCAQEEVISYLRETSGLGDVFYARVRELEADIAELRQWLEGCAL